MKIKFVFAVFACFVLSIGNLYADAYLMDAVRTTTLTEKVTPKPSKSVIAKNCKIYSDTPSDQVFRSAWEMEPQLNLLDIPSNGRIQGRSENFGFKVTHNLSSSFGVYVRYAQRNTTKNKISGSAYDAEWTTQEFSGGVHLYLTPTIMIFGGLGNIWPDNENGSPELETAVERGIAFFHPLGDYRLSVTYRVVEAALKNSEDISEITGDGSYQSVGIGLSIPLNYGHGVSE